MFESSHQLAWDRECLPMDVAILEVTSQRSRFDSQSCCFPRTSVDCKTDIVGDEACNQHVYDLAFPGLIPQLGTDGYAFQPAKREKMDSRHLFGNSLLDSDVEKGKVEPG